MAICRHKVTNENCWNESSDTRFYFLAMQIAGGHSHRRNLKEKIVELLFKMPIKTITFNSYPCVQRCSAFDQIQIDDIDGNSCHSVFDIFRCRTTIFIFFFRMGALIPRHTMMTMAQCFRRSQFTFAIDRKHEKGFQAGHNVVQLRHRQFTRQFAKLDF